MTDLKDISRDLDQLLEEERAALLEGDLARIAAIVDTKAALIEDLRNADPAQASEIAPLQSKLRRNQELFDQTLAGIRNVAARLGDMRRLRREMETYDKQGKRTTISEPAQTRLEKRA